MPGFFNAVIKYVRFCKAVTTSIIIKDVSDACLATKQAIEIPEIRKLVNMHKNKCPIQKFLMKSQFSYYNEVLL